MSLKVDQRRRLTKKQKTVKRKKNKSKCGTTGADLAA